MTFRHFVSPKSHSIALVLAAALAFSSCAEPMTTGQKALAGAAAGAAAGALITGRGRGALVGAGMGAIAGSLIGHAQTERREAAYYGRPYPFGRPASPGYVYSPYPPHSVIDVRGIPPGARIVDPTTDRIFINP